MAVTPIRAQVTIKTDDAVSENYVTNSWCLIASDFPSPTELDEYTACFDTFYTSMQSYFGDVVAQNGHEIKYYDLSVSTPPNYPIGTDTFNLGANPGIDTLPTEVALCLSFQGAKTSGFPQARRRGRIYFGPLNANQTAGGRPAAGVITALSTAAATLGPDLALCTNVATWAVWSPSNGNAVPVEDGWVDNAWDTQRRRGIDRTSRTTFVV